jgi:hypothetical protein
MTGAQPDPVIGSRLFTEAVTRPVIRAPDGGEYVIGPDGGHVHGTWLVPEAAPDTAIIVVDSDRQE